MTGVLIDCDAKPQIRDMYPTGMLTNRWEVRPGDQLPGAVRGPLTFDPKKLGLHRTEEHISISPSNMQQVLKHQPVLDANVLYHLLENPHLIPEAYKDVCVFFYGTIFRVEDDLIILYLAMRKGNDKGKCMPHTLDGFFNISSRYPAAIRLP